MAEILAENLSGKTVVGSDGRELGQLYNITMDITAGALDELIVEPAEEQARDPDLTTDEYGRYRIGVNRVQAVKDHIVVSR
ncbi:MAG: PRC-barrel domain-containing protein [Halobacteriaceae archaeon]